MKKGIINLILNISALCLLSIPPLHADYKSMNDEIKAYTPPQSFTVMSDPGIPKEEQDSGTEDKANPDFSHITDLKASYEKKVSDVSARLLTTGVDKKTVQRISNIAFDEDAVKKQIKKAS